MKNKCPVKILFFVLLSLFLFQTGINAALGSTPATFDDYVQENEKALSALYNITTKGLLKAQYYVGKPTWIALGFTKIGIQGSLTGLKGGMWGALAAAASSMTTEAVVAAARTILKNPGKVAKGIAVSEMEGSIDAYDENYDLYKKGFENLSQEEKQKFLDNQAQVALYDDAKSLYKTSQTENTNKYSDDELSQAAASIESVVTDKSSIGNILTFTDLVDAVAQAGLPVEEYQPYQDFLEVKLELLETYAGISVEDTSEVEELLLGNSDSSKATNQQEQDVNSGTATQRNSALSERQLANYSTGKYGTKDYEHFSFNFRNNKKDKITYRYGVSGKNIYLKYLGPDFFNGEPSFKVKFPNNLILWVIPQTNYNLKVIDKKGSYLKIFKWEYEGPINGIGTFCAPCVGEKESIDLIKKHYLGSEDKTLRNSANTGDPGLNRKNGERNPDLKKHPKGGLGPDFKKYLRRYDAQKIQDPRIAALNSCIQVHKKKDGKVLFVACVHNKPPIYCLPFKVELLYAYKNGPVHSLGIKKFKLSSNNTFLKTSQELPCQGPGEYGLIVCLHFKGSVKVAGVKRVFLPECQMTRQDDPPGYHGYFVTTEKYDSLSDYEAQIKAR